MTILEIGISFPTLVDRRSRHYTTVLPSSIVRSVIETQRNEQSHFYHRRPIVTLAGKRQEETNRNIDTHQEKTNRNVGNTHSSYPYSSRWLEEEEVAVVVDAAASAGTWLRKRTELHWRQDGG
jgi:flagellar biosynthesis/type III secretory pathway M-ring protein FliF/YscJ